MSALVRGFCLVCLLVGMGCASSSPQATSASRYQVERVPTLGESSGERDAGGTARDRLAELRARLQNRTTSQRMPSTEAAVEQSDPFDAASGGNVETEWSNGMYVIQPGDPVIVVLRGIPRGESINEVVDAGGMITLTYIGDIKAAGLTSPQLERRIRDAYIAGKIYNDLTVNVSTPVQSYFMRGEVKRPSRYNLVSRTTLGQAIATAGGYTDYANIKKVKIVRDGQTYIYNMRDVEESPETDPEIRSGDVVIIERSMF